MSRVAPVISYDKTATIAATASTSNTIDLDGTTICGLFIPSGFEGTSVTFLHSNSQSGIFSEIVDVSGAAVSATVSADKYLSLTPSSFAGVRFLKIVSNSTETAQRDIILSVRGI